MQLYAFCARYGHQQLAQMMGRQPTRLELQVFAQCIQDLRESEPPILGGLSAEGASEL